MCDGTICSALFNWDNALLCLPKHKCKQADIANVVSMIEREHD